MKQHFHVKGCSVYKTRPCDCRQRTLKPIMSGSKCCSVNVLAVILEDNLFQRYILPPRMGAYKFFAFLQNDLPEILNDIPALAELGFIMMRRMPFRQVRT